MSLSADVEGVDRLVGTLDAAAAALVDIDLHPIGRDLVAAAIPRTRVRSGRLVDTVRAAIVDDTVVLEAGGIDGVDYAGYVHALDPWLAETVAAETDHVVDQVTDQVVDITDTITGV